TMVFFDCEASQYPAASIASIDRSPHPSQHLAEEVFHRTTKDRDQARNDRSDRHQRELVFLPRTWPVPVTLDPVLLLVDAHDVALLHGPPLALVREHTQRHLDIALPRDRILLSCFADGRLDLRARTRRSGGSFTQGNDERQRTDRRTNDAKPFPPAKHKPPS